MSTFPRGHLNTKTSAGHPTYNVDQATRSADDPPTKVYKTTLAGDTMKLRGIPAIGRGVTGAIPGTSPHLALP